MIDPTLTEMLLFLIKALSLIVFLIIFLSGILIGAEGTFGDDPDEHENTDERIG